MWVVAIGALLDSLIGDPYWMPHPIRLFGNMISYAEKRLNKGGRKVIKGAFMWLIMCSVVYCFFYIAELLIIDYQILKIIWSSIFFFYGISNRCLIEEGLKVERILNRGDLDGARTQLSMIVGRETKALNPHQIRSAVVETMSENLSDGVVAPLLYFAIGGIPLMMLYKMINTLDSMVGYKSDRYLYFGRVAAKMDDVFNFIPSRLTALLMVVVSLSGRAAIHVVKFASCHASPNAGYPESALSGVLDCRLGGPNNYFGKIVSKPYIGINNRELTHKDVTRTAYLNAKVAFVCYLLLIVWSIPTFTNL